MGMSSAVNRKRSIGVIMGILRGSSGIPKWMSSLLNEDC